NWAADGAAKLITSQLGAGRNRLAGSIRSGAVVEERVGGCFCSAIVFVKRTVKVVSTTLGNQLDLTATAATFGRRRVRGDSAKFLNRIDRRVTDSGKRLSGRLVICVDTIDGNVALIGTRPGY